MDAPARIAAVRTLAARLVVALDIPTVGSAALVREEMTIALAVEVFDVPPRALLRWSREKLGQEPAAPLRLRAHCLIAGLVSDVTLNRKERELRDIANCQVRVARVLRTWELLLADVIPAGSWR